MTTYTGFDVDQFPGVAAMDEIKKASNLTFVCFYLAPAPSHHDTGWMEHRAELVAQDWGLVPTYVGQETVGPGSHAVNHSQGFTDGADACGLMVRAGFPPNSFVYLDLENGPPLTADQQAYVRAWVASVHLHGYGAGIYVSHLLAAQVAALVPDARIWAVKVSTTDAHDVSGPPFNGPAPGGSGYAKAFLWQYEQSARITVAGHHLEVDLDTAVSADPSK